jgi:DNA repair protein RecN (Recombination protein N)
MTCFVPNCTGAASSSMLSHLYIRDFTIVHELELTFEPGFTALTGETGAGKSILVDALALALGERADNTVIRHGCARAEIIAGFDLRPDQDAARWLIEHELFSEQECVLRRVIDADKPSRGFINGRPVPLQMLRELGQYLVDIHGQHEHQSMLRRDGQRQILDDYAGLGETLAKLNVHYTELSTLSSRLGSLQRQSTDRDARIDLLRYQVQELEALGISAEELVQLEEEHSRLTNGTELLQGLQETTQALYDDEQVAVAPVLARALSKLEQLARYDVRLGELTTLLRDAGIQVEEVASRLHQYLDKLELDPQRLQTVEQRLASVHDLARKHKIRAMELPQVLEQLSAELRDLEEGDLNIERLVQAIETERQRYLELAREISTMRKQAAPRLDKSVTAQMQQLGMPGGRFAIRLEALASDELSATGLERVEFLVSANPGQPLRPLTKVASGGELSRISLALQVAAAQVARIPTLVFDEVDVGIGGRVAEIVGQQLRRLGESREVLCITHLAQVAALGDRHLQVSKTSKGENTFTTVRALAGRERIDEIARMIGGIKISKKTLAHAQDMLARAVGNDRVSA